MIDVSTHSPGYGTHLPVLTAALAAAGPGPVLELGAGLFSTPVLSAMCRATGRYLVTLEADAAWLERFAELRAPHHEILHASPDWDAVVPRMDAPPRWAVVFVDHAPAERRIVDLARLADRAEFLVVHDANYGHVYGYDPVFATFKYRYDYLTLDPGTTVLSNVRPFPGAPALT